MAHILGKGLGSQLEAFHHGQVGEQLTDLAAALESLPTHYLKTVLLRDFEEITIAERFGEPASAVKRRLHRARELVREYMLGPDASKL